MGGGSYNFQSRATRAVDQGFAKTTLSNVRETFRGRTIDKTLSPKGVVIRESRDSTDHPNSLAILLGIDVTGSMGSVPAKLVSTGLPQIVSRIFDAGIPDPQVGFVAIGDHLTDNYPLQISQFESSDELIDMSLTKIYLEGCGGGNGGESYLLAWYHAAKHTSLDCFEKRGKKGILITIGDEKTHKQISANTMSNLYGGEGSSMVYSASELLAMASKTYHVFHIHVCETMQGHSQETKNDWREMLGDNYIEVENSDDLPDTIAKLVIGASGAESSTAPVQQKSNPQTTSQDNFL